MLSHDERGFLFSIVETVRWAVISGVTAVGYTPAQSFGNTGRNIKTTSTTHDLTFGVAESRVFFIVEACIYIACS